MGVKCLPECCNTCRIIIRWGVRRNPSERIWVVICSVQLIGLLLQLLATAILCFHPTINYQIIKIRLITAAILNVKIRDGMMRQMPVFAWIRCLFGCVLTPTRPPRKNSGEENCLQGWKLRWPDGSSGPNKPPRKAVVPSAALVNHGKYQRAIFSCHDSNKNPATETARGRFDG